jgi:hypothetical protein
MEKKIVDTWGSAAVQCAQDLKKDELKKVAECIATVVAGVSSGKALEELIKWSAECEFEKKEVPTPTA